MKNNFMLNITLGRGIRNSSKFKKQATYMIDKVVELDSSLGVIPKSELNAFKEFGSMCMGIGRELTKTKYTLNGVVIGIVGTIVVLKLRKIRKSKK